MTRLGLAALAFVVTLGAAGASAQPRTVRLWHAYGDAEERALLGSIARFEATHPDVRVEVLRNAFAGYASKLESAVPTGHGPDVFLDAHERLPSYLDAHVIEPYGALPPALADGIETDWLGPLTSGIELYGLPLAIKCAALYVNDALVPTPPRTLEDLERLRATLPADVYPLAMDATDAYYAAALLHAYGSSLLDPAARYGFVGPQAEHAVAHLQSLVRHRVVPEESSGELVARLFASGHAATAISGPWLAPQLPSTLRWHVQPLPRVEAADGGNFMLPYATIEGAFIAAGTPHGADARALAAFLAGPESAHLRAHTGRQIVSWRATWSEPDIAADTFLTTFREAARTAIPMPRHRLMRATFEPARRALLKTLRGDAPAREALEEGERRFLDATRPPPPPASPTPAFFVLGALLLGLCVWMVQRARDATFRAAVRRSVPAYAWVAHAVLAVGLLVVLPLAVGALTSLFAGHGRDLHYVGLANYVDIVTARGGELLGSGSFWRVLLVTVAWTACNLALHVALGVGLALLLDRPTLRLRAAYRVLLILPWAVPSYVTALAWKGMFHRQFGAINAMLELVGVPSVSWFASFPTAFAANVATNVWLGFPFMMVVTLGALQSIPKDLYEAASVDGATAWQRFRHITLPLLAPSIAPAVAMGAVWTFNQFNVVFLLSAGEPDGSTEILVSEAYRWAFTRSQQYGYAAAYAVLIFLLLALTSRFGSARTDGAGGTR